MIKSVEVNDPKRVCLSRSFFLIAVLNNMVKKKNNIIRIIKLFDNDKKASPVLERFEKKETYFVKIPINSIRE
jgi:hypothetical protein